jgi:hemoglobin-like flavoprotein
LSFPGYQIRGNAISTDNSILSRLDFIGIDHETREALRELQPLISGTLPAILDPFYSHIKKYPDMAKMFPNDAIVRHAKEAQLKHWAMIAAATFDDAYVQSVTRIGQTHRGTSRPSD